MTALRPGTRVFVTGASGWIGGFLKGALLASGAALRCLLRRPAPPGDPEGTWVEGDLADPSSYAAALRDSDVVVHLAARTGKAREHQYFETNLAGTCALLEAARAAGVRRFVFVSTIAVAYPEKRHYPYARSKEAAESAVQRSGLEWLILRPTIVLGPGSPAGRAFAQLAAKPRVLLFGDGRTRIQPIHVEDLCQAIVLALAEERKGEVLELGGPEAVSLEEFLLRLQEKLRGRRGGVLHLPLRAAIAGLALAEKPLGGMLPLTAGQLYAFAHDSTARDNDLQARLRPSMQDLGAMLASTAADA